MPEPQEVYIHADEQVKLRNAYYQIRQFKKSKLIVFLSIACYLFSLFNNGYYDCAEGAATCGEKSALSLLLYGWIGIFVGIYSWYANPVLIAGWLLCSFAKFHDGRIASMISVMLMLSFLLHKKIETSAPPDVYITGYGPGYILWVVSALILYVSCEVGMKSPPRLAK